MGGQHVQLGLGGVAGLDGLLGGDLGAEHDVTQQSRAGLLLVVLRPARDVDLVHREGQHVGGAGLVHPLDVQGLHGRHVDQQHRQLGERAHAHGGEDERGQPGQLCLVDLDPGLVGDLDGHAYSSGLVRATGRGTRDPREPC
jgi:hypothetical protein